MSKNFSIAELCRSTTAERLGIDNTPTREVENNLNMLITQVLQPLRDVYGKPIHVTSGYRSPRLNKAVGGVSTSHHLRGFAADILGFDRSVAETNVLFRLLEGARDKAGKKLFTFTQLIWEHDKRGNYWVHVSYVSYNLKRQVIDNLEKK